MKKDLLIRFLREHKGTPVKLILCNGFQLQGVLRDFDKKCISIASNQYETNGLPVTVSMQYVSTYIPVSVS